MVILNKSDIFDMTSKYYLCHMSAFAKSPGNTTSDPLLACPYRQQTTLSHNTVISYEIANYPEPATPFVQQVILVSLWCHVPFTRHVKLRGAYVPGMPGIYSPPPRVRDPDIYHGTCAMHVSWFMSGSLSSGFLWIRWQENVPGISGACATRNFTYLGRGPWHGHAIQRGTVIQGFNIFFIVILIKLLTK